MSDQLFLILPALLALLLLAFFATPVEFAGMAMVPNVAWVMTLIMAYRYPAAWPRWFAFILGLLQDVLFGTPLGSQALLTLLLVQLVESQARRQTHQRFRVRWLEAAGALLIWHLLLWAICHMVQGSAAPLHMMLGAGLASAVWYPLFYLLLGRFALLLPSVK